MESLQKFPWMDTLPSGSLHQRRDDTMGFDSAVGTVAEADLPHDYHLAQGLLGVIVRGRNARDAQKSEEMFLVSAVEKGSQCLGGFEGKRPFADSLQLRNESSFDVRRIFP